MNNIEEFDESLFDFFCLDESNLGDQCGPVGTNKFERDFQLKKFKQIRQEIEDELRTTEANIDQLNNEFVALVNIFINILLLSSETATKFNKKKIKKILLKKLKQDKSRGSGESRV